MILGFSDPVSRWVILAILLVIVVGVLAFLWFIIRAVCRRFELHRYAQMTIFIIFALLLFSAAIEIWRDKLDDLEQICKNEFMKSAQASSISEFEIRKHVNGWNRGWSTMGGYTEPFVDPLVWLWISFTRDGAKHHAQVRCRFTKSLVQESPLNFVSIGWK